MQSLEAEVQAELDSKGWNKKSLQNRINDVLQRRRVSSFLTGDPAISPATTAEKVRSEAAADKLMSAV